MKRREAVARQGAKPAVNENVVTLTRIYTKIYSSAPPSNREALTGIEKYIDTALEHSRDCVYCIVQPATRACIPCGHRVLCDSPECAPLEFDKCPVCRTIVYDIYRIY